PLSSSLYPSGCMTPGVATLRKDPASAAAQSEAADVALAPSGEGGAFERLYRPHLARIQSLCRRVADADQEDDQTQDPYDGARTSKSQLHHARMALRKHLD